MSGAVFVPGASCMCGITPISDVHCKVFCCGPWRQSPWVWAHPSLSQFTNMEEEDEEYLDEEDYGDKYSYEECDKYESDK